VKDSRRYVIVCEKCGAPRKSSKPPGTPYTPKVCRQCNLDRSRVDLARMMRQPVKPELRRAL
jgi:hypothetical protein